MLVDVLAQERLERRIELAAVASLKPISGPGCALTSAIEATPAARSRAAEESIRSRHQLVDHAAQDLVHQPAPRELGVARAHLARDARRTAAPRAAARR